MDKKKVAEANIEFQKCKSHAEKQKIIKKNSNKYDFDSVDINEIRKEVYEYMEKHNTPTIEEMHRKFNI